MESMFDRLGELLRDRLQNDEDPFTSWDPLEGKARQAGNHRQRTPPPRKTAEPIIPVPPELEDDYHRLGVEVGRSLATCKSAWKTLLKKHHPDKHNNDPVARAAATRKTGEINDSWRRIERWFLTGERP